MKPFHLLVIGAVLAVGALLYFALDDSSGHRQQRTDVDRSSEPRTGGGDENGASDGDAGGSGGRTHGLEATLTVLAPDGEPAAGATLTVHGAGSGTATAGGDGVARLALRPGFYSVVATHGNATGSIGFELAESTDLGTLQLHESISIRGTVYDSKGVALSGATVEAVVSMPMQGWNLGRLVQRMTEPEEVAAHATTGPDGKYELKVGSGGSFALRVTATGFAQENEPGRAYSADVEGLDFYLFAGTSVTGTVLTEGGDPIANASVIVVDPQRMITQRTAKTETFTNADGTFALALMPSQQMVLVVRAAGFAAHMKQLTLPARDLEIRLARGITVKLRTIEEETGEPAPAISVALNYKGGFKVGETDENGVLVLENMPVEGPRGWGSQQQLFLWGGGFVSKLERIKDAEVVDGLLDLGEVGMEKGGVVRGKVLDGDSGEPIAGAQVRTWGGLNMQLQWLDPARVVSAADGTFELTGVPLGATALSADHPDYVSTFDPTTIFSGMGGGNPIFAEGEKTLRRNVTLTRAGGITGIVLGPDGAPVAGARVATVEQGQSAFLKMLVGRTSETFSDAEGRFRLGGLKPGETVKLRATHRSFGASAAVDAAPGGSTAITLELAAPIEIHGKVVDGGGEPVAGVRITVARAGNDRRSPNPFAAMQNDGLTARPAVTNDAGEYVVRNAPEGDLVLTFDHPGYRVHKEQLRTIVGAPVEARKAVLDRGAGIEGIVVDEAGEPVAGAAVNATVNFGAQPDGQPGRTWANTTSGDDGTFSMYGLHEGQVTVRVYRDGWYCRPLTVPSGATGVRLVVAEAGELRGRVMAAGRPVANANINAQLDGPEDPGAAQGRFLAWGRTAADGTFTLKPLPPRAPFKLVITHQSYKQTTIQGVTASDGRVRDFTLEAGLQVGGIVVDEGGKPVPTASVVVKHESGKQQWARTDTDGRWSVGGLEPGKLTVELGRGAYIPTDPIAVTPGAMDIRLVAVRGERISGKILFPDGSKVRVRIDAVDAEGKVANSAWAWPQNSSFAIVGLPHGTYTLRATEWRNPEPGKVPEQRLLTTIPNVRTGTDNVEIDLR